MFLSFLFFFGSSKKEHVLHFLFCYPFTVKIAPRLVFLFVFKMCFMQFERDASPQVLKSVFLPSFLRRLFNRCSKTHSSKEARDVLR